VTHFPAKIKAFYMQPDKDRPDLALGVDFLASEGFGEIIGGGQRIHDLDLLEQRIKEFNLPADAYNGMLISGATAHFPTRVSGLVWKEQ